MTILVPAVSSQPVAGDCQEDLAATRRELNETKERLAEVEKERDDYAQRLESSTVILIVVLFLLVGSYLVFYINTRRQQVAFQELEKRTGVSLSSTEPRPRKRRRG